jgi:HlyD family secretion protein
VAKAHKAADEAYATGDSSARQQAAASLESAQTQLARLREDRASAKQKAIKDAASALAAASAAYESAKTARDRLQKDIAQAKAEAVEDAAEALESARQDLESAQTALEKAQRAYSQAKEDFADTLAENEDAYQSKLEAYEKDKEGSSNVKGAAMAVKDAELALEDAENALDNIKIYSPIDGQVLNVSKKAGEKVSAVAGPAGAMVFGTSGAGSAVITVCDLSQVYLTANITEGDIVGVEVGQAVNVTLDSIEASAYTGAVETVSSLPTTDSSGITSYAVTVKLGQADPAMKDGMAALLTFVRLEHPNVLLIPNKAVFIEDGKQYVYIPKGDTYEKRAVSCGLTDGTQTEVLSGLEEGDTVVNGQLPTTS